MRFRAVFFALLPAVSLLAQDRRAEDYVRVLVPVQAQFAQRGAHGAQWATSLWIRNDGAASVDVFPVARTCVVNSGGCFARARPYPGIEPLESLSAFHDVLGSRSGVGQRISPTGEFLYVERCRFDDISMQLHAGDVRKPAGEWTRIPLVSEKEFFDTTRSIIGLPLQSGNRLSLRVFQLDPLAGAEIILRVHEAAVLQSGATRARLLAERRLAFNIDETPCVWLHCPEGFEYRPGFIAIGDLLHEVPETASAVDRELGIRIEIEPVTPGLRYWPMVTVTDNATNHLAVYTVK
jgi:hypothetical protein